MRDASCLTCRECLVPSMSLYPLPKREKVEGRFKLLGMMIRKVDKS